MSDRGGGFGSAVGRRAHGARRALRQLGVLRLLVALFVLAAALVLARYSWHLPLAINAERALYDIRFTISAPRVDQDSRIVEVVYNDDTLINTYKRSPLDRATLAKALAALDAMGAKAIGIDIMIDQPQLEDPQLIAAFRAMRTPTYLAYVAKRTNEGNIEQRQEDYLHAFHRRIAGPSVHPASVRFLADTDGSMRSWPEQPRSLPPLLADAMTGAPQAARDYQRAIGYRLPRTTDSQVISKLPIDIFADPSQAPLVADAVKGRYVLIGGDIIDSDEFATPLSWYVNGTPMEDRPRSGKMIGLEVHAHMLAQLLDGRWFGALPGWAPWTLAILVVLAASLTAMADLRPIGMGAAMLVQAVLFLGLPFYLQAKSVDTTGLPAFGWVIGWILAYSAAGAAARALGSEQRRFAQSALGKYLPRDIAAAIMRDPDSLALHGEKREIFVIFTDLEGFTKLSHAIEPEMVATLLNRYLEMLSNVVLEYGGTIDKFVGDAVVAFWGAPIARPDDGERAARAAVAMHAAGEEFRRTVPDGVPAIGKTRVGLHHGEAIVGNFGGEGRIQYTALGDSMNTASRLESASKKLGTSVLASREAAELSGLDWWRPMGRVVLRGRATPVDVMEAAPAMSADERGELADLLARGRVAADVAPALAAIAARHPADAGLANLVERYAHLDSSGAYVLD